MLFKHSQGGEGCMSPVVVGNCNFMYFVQSNIQHASPAFGGSPDSHRAVPLDPAGYLRPSDPLFCPLSKFLAVPVST